MKLYVVGIGPGEAAQITPLALQTIQKCQVIVGYSLYLHLIDSYIQDKECISTGMKGEVERCKMAVETALSGKRVAVISSGDAGVYGMASLVLELAAPYPQLKVEIIPGVTAATAAAAVLGAPLGHDFAVISLSDLLTSWDVIESRLRLCARADMIICLYNPASHNRPDHLRKACDILLDEKQGDTLCGIVRDAGRIGEMSRILTLDELARTDVDMLTTVIIGNKATKIISGRMVTPRGYTLQ